MRCSVIRFMIDSTSSVGAHTRTSVDMIEDTGSSRSLVFRTLRRLTMSRSETMPSIRRPSGETTSAPTR